MPYRTVARALDKKLFLSISGPFSRQFGQLFCGTFMEYTDGYHPATYRQLNSPEARRIHDGIVVYTADDMSHIPRLTYKQLTRILLRDACVLFLDSHLAEKDDRCIQVKIPSGTPNPDLQYVTTMIEVIPVLARAMENWWVSERIVCFRRFWEEAVAAFRRHYESLKNSVGTVWIGDLTEKETRSLCFDENAAISLRFKNIMQPFAEIFYRLDKTLCKEKNSRIPPH